MNYPNPSTLNTVSRRTAIDLITGPLAPHKDALTLVGGQAVMLRTIDRYGLNAETSDADFTITPELVTDDPHIEQTLRDSGYEPRIDSRPGLWGRGRRIDEMTGRVVWQEQFDLDCPYAFSGNTDPRKRSVRALLSHGKGSANPTPGLELAAADRSLMEVSDLANPEHRAVMWVANAAGLVCAKSYKIGERLYESDRGSSLRDKDYVDLFLLMDSSVPAEISTVFNHYAVHPVVGDSVAHGAELFGRLLHDPSVDLRMRRALDRLVPGDVLENMLRTWNDTFGS